MKKFLKKILGEKANEQAAPPPPPPISATEKAAVLDNLYPSPDTLLAEEADRIDPVVVDTKVFDNSAGR